MYVRFSLPYRLDKAPFQQLLHTFLGSYIDQGQISVHMDQFQLLFHASLGSYTDQEQIPIYTDLY